MKHTSKGIFINKYIYSILKECKELTDIVGDRLSPLSIEPTDFPFCTYERLSVQPTYTMDGLVMDDVAVAFYCVSDDYSQSLDIANIIRNNLEQKYFENEEVIITNIELESIQESVEDEIFVQEMVMTMQIVDNQKEQEEISDDEPIEDNEEESEDK